MTTQSLSIGQTQRDAPTAPADPKLQHDLKTLVLFIELYCHQQHASSQRQAPGVRGFDAHQIAGKEVALCPDCCRLLAHAMVKRSHCPMSPKPSCKHCPAHCYHPRYRAAIQEVMRFSGRKMVLGGRLDYLLHLLF